MRRRMRIKFNLHVKEQPSGMEMDYGVVWYGLWISPRFRESRFSPLAFLPSRHKNRYRFTETWFHISTPLFKNRLVFSLELSTRTASTVHHVLQPSLSLFCLVCIFPSDSVSLSSLKSQLLCFISPPLATTSSIYF